MAEHVQATLDQMVAPLRDLQERGIFSPEEIHSIVERRRSSEYALRRRQPRQADFLSYIQAEMNLEQLRKLRDKRLRSQQQQQAAQDPTTSSTTEQQQSKRLGDKHIIQHIHLLWLRTLRKYRSNVELYLQYADFCKSTNSHRRLSRCYAEAMQYHPKQTGLYIEAASHEFFALGSVQNARIILQRGLRMNPIAQDLWIQSFVLELHFVQKMQGRRTILLGNSKAESTTTSTVDDESHDKDNTFALAKLVFDNAIQAVPDNNNIAFRLAFLDQCRLFPHAERLEQHIVDAIHHRDGRSRDHQQPQAWIARAMYAWEKLEQQQQQQDSSSNRNSQDAPQGFLVNESIVDDGAQKASEPSKKKQRKDDDEAEGGDERDPVLAVIREATDTLKTEDMFLEAIRFLSSYYIELEQEESDTESDNAIMEMRMRRSKCLSLLDTLFQEASSSDFNSPTLALLYADHLVEQEKASRAVEVLEMFVDKTSSKDKIESSVWTRWAGLVFPESRETAINILERALKYIPTDQSSHMVVLLQLLGAKLEAGLATDEPLKLLERILLLAPGFAGLDEIEDPPFDIKSVLDACIKCLRYLLNLQGLDGARKTYNLVLFQSGFAKMVGEKNAEELKQFLDESIEAEKKCRDVEARKPRLHRLYKTAIELFRGSPQADEYRESRDEDLLYGASFASKGDLCPSTLAIPSFDAASPDFSPTAFTNAFQVFQVVHLQNATTQRKDPIKWQDIGRIFKRLNASDRRSWCVETNTGTSISHTRFLRPVLTEDRAYTSFLIQNDRSAYEKALGQLPLADFDWTEWYYEPVLWVFFGRNPPGSPNLEGRPEHTDSISHDGTWHYQLSGKKEWYLRPSPKLFEHIRHHVSAGNEKNLWREETHLRVVCRKGDVIVINTGLWFHRTVIPPQKYPCVSYARDFRLQSTVTEQNVGGMTNVDGLFATEDIDAGTILFTEIDMPDCELHRSSSNPNCEVVDLEDGTSAVLTSRQIAAGEFFSVPESDDSEEDEQPSIQEEEEEEDDDE